MMQLPSTERKITGAILLVISFVFSGYAAHQAHRNSLEIAIREELASVLVDSDENALVAMDMHGSILFWNRAMEKLTGYTAESIRSCGIGTIITDKEYMRRHQAGLQRVLRDPHKIGKVTETRCTIATLAGVQIPVVLTIFVHHSRYGDPFAIARVIEDSKYAELPSKTKVIP